MSLSLDTQMIFDWAEDIFQALAPIIVISAGISLGLYLAKKIGGMFKALG